MAFLIVDGYSGNEPMDVNTLDEVFDYFRDEEIEQRCYKGDHPKVYEYIREVKIEAQPAVFRVVNDTPATDIPAPLPGETVSDYARRITGA